jgi:hypothetical protein
MESTALDGTSAAGSSPQQARACRNCAISKVKCNPCSRSENGKCERYESPDDMHNPVLLCASSVYLSVEGRVSIFRSDRHNLPKVHDIVEC